MRIHHAVTTILEEAAGPSSSVPALCAGLADLKHEVSLHVLEPVRPMLGDYALTTYPRSGFLERLCFSNPMKRGLHSAAAGSEILHSHGLWLMPNIYARSAVRDTDCRLFVSPRGMLDPWALRHHAIRKRVVWYAGQRAVLADAACIHATAPMEYDWVRALGLRAPVAVIPNGIDIPACRPTRDRPGGRRRLLFLARIHPKKGIDRLVRAWHDLSTRHPDWELQVVGNDDGYLPEIRRLAATLGVERIEITGKIPEEEKSSYYYDSDLYILPTHAENWGMSVAEALAHGIPAIVGRGAPWEGLETHGCGWWIDNSVEAITASLDTALALPVDDLRERGRRGRDWVAREFSWSRVATMMEATYNWAVHGGKPPEWVVLD